VTPAFEREDAEQFVVPVRNVGASLGRPAGIQNSRNSPIAWSMRSAPALAKLARSSALKKR
jgi:hypothetical protein